MWIKQKPEELPRTLADSTVQTVDVETFSINDLLIFWVGREQFVSQQEPVHISPYKLILLGANKLNIGTFASLADAKQKALDYIAALHNQLGNYLETDEKEDSSETPNS